jgi:hypothetical protein
VSFTLKTSPNSFQGLRLRGGFIIVRIEFVVEPLVDAIGRSALAKTQIVGHEFHLTVLSSLSDKEKSVTLYHEILEAMTVASFKAPASVQDFNEGDFERAAYEAHKRYGPVSPESIDRMLQFYGFREE